MPQQQPVTDPALLAQLNARQIPGLPPGAVLDPSPSSSASTPTVVTDPAILAQLNGGHWNDPPGIERTHAGIYAPGLYHYTDEHGNEVFSKNPPMKMAGPSFVDENGVEYEQPGARPYVPITAATAGTDAENFDAGVGKAFVDIGRGSRQIYAHTADWLDPRAPSLSRLVTGQDPSRSAAVQREIDEARQTDAPLMGTKAGLVGNLAGNAALVSATLPLLPASLPGTALGVAGLGATQGALQPVATGDSSRLVNTGMGATLSVGGRLLGSALSRVAKPVENVLSTEEQQAVQTLRDAGIPLTPGQQTGSRFLQQLASSLKDNPITAGKAAGVQAAQQTGFNRAALATIGEDAPAATQSVMARARDRIGKVFSDVAARNPVQLDTQMASDLQSVMRDATRSLTADQAAVVQGHVTDIVDAAARNGGEIDGAAWQRLYSSLGRLTRSPDYGTFANDLRDTLHGGLMRSASNPADVEALETARQQYQAMKQIEGAIAADSSGNVSVQKLSSALAAPKNRFQSIYGGGNQDLVQLAKAGRTILPDVLSNSGTPARLEAGAAPGVLANAGIDLLSGKPVEAAKKAATGFAPKWASPTALSTGRYGDYVSNGVSSDLARMLLQAPSTPAGRTLMQYTPDQLRQLLTQSLQSQEASAQ